MFSRLPAIVTQIAAASGLMSFVSFAYVFWKDASISEAQFIQTLHEGEIYGIVFEGSPDGVLFPAILDELNRRIEQRREALGDHAELATTESLRRALIELSQKGIVQLREDHTYVVPMAPARERNFARVSP